MDSIERNARLDAHTILERRLEADMRFHGHDVVTAEVQILVHGQLNALAAAGLTLLPLEPDDATVDEIADAIVAAEETESSSGKRFYRAVARAVYRAAVKGGR